MNIDLTELRENQLKKFPYEDVLKVVEALEEINISVFSGRKAIEDIEQYVSFLNIIKNRLENNDIPELELENKTNENNH